MNAVAAADAIFKYANKFGIKKKTKHPAPLVFADPR